MFFFFQNYLKSENPALMTNETRALVLDASSALVYTFEKKNGDQGPYVLASKHRICLHSKLDVDISVNT